MLLIGFLTSGALSPLRIGIMTLLSCEKQIDILQLYIVFIGSVQHTYDKRIYSAVIDWFSYQCTMAQAMQLRIVRFTKSAQK